jgi:tetratricopeptide (TPR) repeat protein
MKPADNRHSNRIATAFDYDELVEDVLAPADVHDASMVSAATASNGLFVIAAIILSVLHGLNLYLFISSGIWPIIPVLIHLALVGITAIIAYGQYKKGMDARHLSILAIISATTGVFGTVGALVGFIGSGIFAGRAKHFNDWYESIFPTDSLSQPQEIYDRILEGFDENPHHYSVSPFLDVMHLGSENQKRRALAKMTSRFNARFAEAFRVALRDSNNTIRVQAATAIAKIEKEFTYKLERIELARAQEPNNPLLTLALAKFYDDYAFTGVLDSERERSNRERAISTYKSYLQQDPNSEETWIAIGRLLFRNHQWNEAAEWFRNAIDRGWRMKTMLMWYFECLFRLGRYRDLRRALLEHGRGVINQDDMPAPMRDAVSLWIQVA